MSSSCMTSSAFRSATVRAGIDTLPRATPTCFAIPAPHPTLTRALPRTGGHAGAPRAGAGDRTRRQRLPARPQQQHACQRSGHHHGPGAAVARAAAGQPAHAGILRAAAGTGNGRWVCSCARPLPRSAVRAQPPPQKQQPEPVLVSRGYSIAHNIQGNSSGGHERVTSGPYGGL